MLNRFVVLFGLILAFSPVMAEEMTEAEPVAETEMVAEPMETTVSGAEQTAKTVCAACHGADGNSVIAVNPKLAGQHADYLYKQLMDFKSEKRKNGIMGPLVAGLSEAQMRDLAQYFAKQSIKLSTAKTNGKGSLGERIYRGGIMATKVPACASCHGANGAGMPKQFPRLASQHADYTLQQLKLFRTGERGNAPMMTDIATKMTEAEMAAVADYIQGLR